MLKRTRLALITTGLAWTLFAFPASSAYASSNGNNNSVVGMWHAVMRLGNGGPIYDEILEHFHADGTELLVSNSLPPALGNICIGVWKRTGPRTYKLKHMTWNWAPDVNEGFGVPGTHSGHFELELTLRLDPGGKTYRGTWSAKNYDLSGEHIAELDVEGTIRGTRISVE